MYEEGPAGTVLDAVQQDPHGRLEAQARWPSACHYGKLLVRVVGLQRRRHHDIMGTQQVARKSQCRVQGGGAYSRSSLSLPSAATPLGAPRCPPPAANPWCMGCALTSTRGPLSGGDTYSRMLAFSAPVLQESHDDVTALETYKCRPWA